MPVAAGGQASCLNLPDLEFIGEQARSYGYVSSEQSGPKGREPEYARCCGRPGIMSEPARP